MTSPAGSVSGPLCRALVCLALVRAAVATTPVPTPVPTCADEWSSLVGVMSRNMSFPTPQYTNLFESEVTTRAQQRAPSQRARVREWPRSHVAVSRAARTHPHRRVSG